MHRTRFAFAALATLAAGTLQPLAAHAMDTVAEPDRNPRAYAQLGRAGHRAGTVAVGVQIPWGWSTEGGALTGYWDIQAAHWRVASPLAGGGRSGLTHLGVLPSLRWRFDGGRSAWFAEAGTAGLTVTDVPYHAPGKPFSTRFNFASHAGVGLAVGGGRHEVALRVQHVSNGGIERPNPGENFVQLRWASRF